MQTDTDSDGVWTGEGPERSMANMEKDPMKGAQRVPYDVIQFADQLKMFSVRVSGAACGPVALDDLIPLLEEIETSTARVKTTVLKARHDLRLGSIAVDLQQASADGRGNQ